MFCPLNSRKIKRSRASERSDQALKDDFHRSRFLIAVATPSMGNTYVTTPSIYSDQTSFLCERQACETNFEYGLALKDYM